MTQDDKLPQKQNQQPPSWMSNLPNNIQPSLVKAFRFLAGKGGYAFDSISKKIRTNKSKEILMVGAASHIVEGYGSDDATANRVLKIQIDQLIAKQENIDDILEIAAEDIFAKSNESKRPNSEPSTENDADISDDWLNLFRREAENFSSADMKLAFGRLLSEEIQNPGSFSPRTLQSLATLTTKAAKGLKIFGSCAFSNPAISPIVCSMGSNAGNSELGSYGLHYALLAEMQENGLIPPSLSTYQMVASIGFTLPNKLGGQPYVGVNFDDSSSNAMIQLDGIALTAVGRELLSITDLEPNNAYVVEFIRWLRSNHNVMLIPNFK